MKNQGKPVKIDYFILMEFKHKQEAQWPLWSPEYDTTLFRLHKIAIGK